MKIGGKQILWGEINGFCFYLATGLKEKTMFKRLKKNKKGLTLIEVLIALLVSLLVVGPFIKIFMVSKLVLLKTQNRLVATDLVKARMEWAKAQNYSVLQGIVDNDSVEDNVDESETGINMLRDDTRITQVESVESYIEEDEAFFEVFKVTVILNWSKQGLMGSLEKGTINDPDEKMITLITRYKPV